MKSLVAVSGYADVLAAVKNEMSSHVLIQIIPFDDQWSVRVPGKELLLDFLSAREKVADPWVW